MRFEWDERKNRTKHGIDFDFASLAFDDPFALTIQDRDSDGEQRYQLIGAVFTRIILVAHAVRSGSRQASIDIEPVVRIISARKATPADGDYMKKTQPTKDLKRQIKALDTLLHADIDLSDVPDQGNKTGWVRGLMYRPVMRAISIRLPVPDIALAQDLAGKKGLPYQTYIKKLLHDALDRERAAQ